MAEHRTIKERIVDHFHFEPDLHDADEEIAARLLSEHFPKAEVVKPATRTYNCHGFALASEHPGWYNFPDFFLSDNYRAVPMECPQLGDVLIYSSQGAISHSAVVIEVRGSEIVKLQSKWGEVAQVKHAPGDVPGVYGERLVLLRPRPGVPKHPAVVAIEKAAAGGSGGAEEPAGRGGLISGTA